MKDLTRCVMTPEVNIEGFKSLAVGVHRASTIVFDNAEDYSNRGNRGPDGYSYGLYGTPTTRTLEAKLTALEQGARTFLVPSGQAANVIAVLPFLKAGDGILITDSTYPPMRDFANTDLARFGVEVSYYNPVDLADLEIKINDRTKIVWCESPGSTTMEVQDLPKIAAIAHRHGALVGCDNTWATPLNYKPLTHGADIVTEGLTKYISGHSDLLLGSLTVRDEQLVAPIRSTLGRLGISVSPDDASLVLRGMETLGVRMRHACEVAMSLMGRLQESEIVQRVIHPALPSDPGNPIWRRDFLGASAVFGVAFAPGIAGHVPPSLDVLKTFAIGASWGGTRSLVAPMSVKAHRSATRWPADDLILRISVGLEDQRDLLDDIDALLAEITSRARG
ncbi:aminotransferase class I/II-fold pyridoxal phosphate-dependent enzyme [Rhizobium leguminosarum]|uniref:trans-sulfuration enzyme family protein n=1 Tax=Rhizobium leguminosarum TaxID=384 RepID=UPI001C981586|nr:aminotransferase class I/II-fold pyridoxal phosphate-dependent enzyme [Rhizobium leguminosarum]MBY5590875.1 aminotransferase class I/II-fold pyridoxal phosphate-dependent enzyme [Rhizobium leguminosarum]